MKVKKGVNILILSVSIIFLISSLGLIIAQEVTEIDKAYACFESELGDDCGGSRSTKQNAFNLLASSYDGGLQADCKTSLLDKLRTDCWGETDTGSCGIKSTALATLALEHIQEDVDDYRDWLLSKKITNTGLTWFLEIDANNKTVCDINGKSVTIEDNKKITGSSPVGLSKAYNNYWFEIKDIKKNYTISCDRDFITALLYQKPSSTVFYVSSETKSASEFDTIVEKVNSFCFSTSNQCDYEGSLWASLALAKLGEDASPYLPYIVTMADKTENKKYLPSSFLYILTHSDDYYDEIVSLQKSGNFWDESRNKFYDTALALLALSDVSTDETDRARKYLISVQKDSGCWQSDTAFILHSVWPRSALLSGGGGATISFCEDFGYYCQPSGECEIEDKLNNFYCSSVAEICCQKRFQESTCSEKAGIICNLDEDCSGNRVAAYDTSECCLGDCVLIDIKPECVERGYDCRTSCDDSTEEEKISYSSSCSFDDVCCSKKPVEESRFGGLLMFLLIVLIILIILAIIFRKKLKMWIGRFRGRKNAKNARPISRQPRMAIPRALSPIRRPVPRYSARPRPSPGKDKEFDDTMKKLRDMSK